MTDQQLIETLLYRGEGEALDFKLEQYKFEKSGEEEKSELLKDILAFANSWREAPAYIVIGVRETPRQVEGLDKDIDDAKLQQFVNEKTNKPIHFSYHSLQFDGKRVGLYTIPVQERPFYLKKPFGKLKSDVVYVRRGSSTAEAKPDEIAKMGVSLHTTASQPKLKVKLICNSDELPFDTLNFEYQNFVIPEDLPDYTDAGATLPSFARIIPNKNFYREMAKYLHLQAGLFGLRIEIENTGGSFADDVNVIMTASSTPGLRLLSMDDLPNRPSTIPVFNVSNFSGIGLPSRRNLWIKSEQGKEVAQFFIGKIQAGETATSATLFIANPPETLTSIKIKILSDQLSSPMELEVPVVIKHTDFHLSTDFIDKLLESEALQ